MSGKQAKRKRQAEREVIPRALRDHADLASKLREQVGFLRNSAQLFDQGDVSESVRLATTIRTLVYEGPTSHSLLGQLGIKERLRWENYGQPIDDTNLMPAIPGLFFMRSDEDTSSYVPRSRADRSPDARAMTTPFDAWWTDPATRLPGNRTLCRSDYVLTAANKEGGAHVDRHITDLWHELETANPFGWTYMSPTGPRPLEGHPGLIGIRTIAAEVLDTLGPVEQLFPD